MLTLSVKVTTKIIGLVIIFGIFTLNLLFSVSPDDPSGQRAVTPFTPASPSSHPSARRRTAARATRLNILAQVNDPPSTANTEAGEPRQPQPHSILNTCDRLWLRSQVCTTIDLWRTLGAWVTSPSTPSTRTTMPQANVPRWPWFRNESKILL